jgi:hypothetical protein
MEEQQDKGLESREELKKEEETAAKNAADQDRRKCLLTTIVEYHLGSVKAYLKIYERYMEGRWNHADFNEREDFMEALAGNVEYYCKQFSSFMESGGWKDKEEVAVEMKCNPMRSD